MNNLIVMTQTTLCTERERPAYAGADQVVASLKLEAIVAIDPTRINKDDLRELRHSIAYAYGIDLHRQYGERAAAGLLVPPGERRQGSADVSTIKRKRRAGKIPHTPLGDSSVAYLGMMLVDFIAFGERSVPLWGGEAGGSDSEGKPSSPTGGPAPTAQDGGWRKANEMDAEGEADGPVHEA